MGRIIVQVELSNPQEDKSMLCSMFVDTEAGAVVLPMAWKERLGEFAQQEEVEFLLANNQVVKGEVCGPAGIRIEGFRKIFSEVTFREMGKSDRGECEPLLGYVPLEQSQAAVDMVGHRLIPVRYIDCK